MGVNSLSSPRYPLSYPAFSCLEIPKVSRVIILPETENIFVNVFQRNNCPRELQPLLQILFSAPRLIGLGCVNTPVTQCAKYEPEPTLCTGPQPTQNLGKRQLFCPSPCLESGLCKRTPDLKEIDCDLGIILNSHLLFKSGLPCYFLSH